MKTKFALAILIFWLCTLLTIPWIRYEAMNIHLSSILSAPSLSFILGTDDVGRSIAMRLPLGIALSLGVTVIVTTICLIIGSCLGVIAGFYGGYFDRALGYISNVCLAFPGFLLAVAFSAVLGAGLWQMIGALCFSSWVHAARMVRIQTLKAKQSTFVFASLSLGASPLRLLQQHILPTLYPFLLVEAGYLLTSIVMSEAGLSFLGLGIPAPYPSLGSMLRDSTRYLLIAPHYMLIVSVALMSLVFSMTILNDGLRDNWDIQEKNLS